MIFFKALRVEYAKRKRAHQKQSGYDFAAGKLLKGATYNEVDAWIGDDLPFDMGMVEALLDAKKARMDRWNINFL